MDSGKEKDPPEGTGNAADQHHNQSNVRIANAIEAISKQLETGDKENGRRDNRRWNLERLALGVATFYAVVTFCLWISTRHSIDITRHDFEVAHGADITVDKVSDFVLVPGADAVFPFKLSNSGHTRATIINVAIDNEIVKAGEQPAFHFDCFSRRKLQTPPGEDEWLHLQTVIGASKLEGNTIVELLTGGAILRAYGMVLYSNGFCLRCTSFCYVFIPLAQSPADPNRITGFAGRCENRPGCSRFGRYEDQLSCIQSDASDIYGYYPESDESGLKFNTGRCNIPDAVSRVR